MKKIGFLFIALYMRVLVGNISIVNADSRLDTFCYTGNLGIDGEGSYLYNSYNIMDIEGDTKNISLSLINSKQYLEKKGYFGLDKLKENNFFDTTLTKKICDNDKYNIEEKMNILDNVINYIVNIEGLNFRIIDFYNIKYSTTDLDFREKLNKINSNYGNVQYKNENILDEKTINEIMLLDGLKQIIKSKRILNNYGILLK